MFFGKLATHVTRLRKEVVSLAGARLYRALAATEGRLNFTQSTSPTVVTTACLCHSTNMQTLSPLPDSTRPLKAEILPVGLCFLSRACLAWSVCVERSKKKITQSLASKDPMETRAGAWQSQGLLWLCVHPGQGSPPSHVPMGFCSEAGSMLREDPPFHGAEPFFDWNPTYDSELS